MIEVLFYAVTAVALAGGVVTVTARSVRIAAFGCGGAALATASLCALAGAYIAAGVLAVAAIASALVLRRSHIPPDILAAGTDEPASAGHRFAALIASVSVGVLLVVVVWTVPQWRSLQIGNTDSLGDAGQLFAADDVLYLLLLPMVMLVAIVVVRIHRSDGRRRDVVGTGSDVAA